MTVVLELKPKTEELLQKAIKVRGVEPSGYIESLIERDAAFLSVEERLEPVRRSFEESRITEDELDEFMNGVLKKVRAERKPKNK